MTTNGRQNGGGLSVPSIPGLDELLGGLGVDPGNGSSGGIGGFNPGLPQPPTAEQIVEWHDAEERATQPLRARMEEDWELAVLSDFDAGDGYQSYTSNEPRVFWLRLVSLLASGQINIRIPVKNAQREQRERQDGKERFLYGLLAANDERLLNMGLPALLSQLSSFLCLRGWSCGRAMLTKDIETGETYADVTPFDPLHTTWSFGRKGLKWICNKSKKTLDEIEDEYGVRERDRSGSLGQGLVSGYVADEQGIDVYDYLDQWYSIVVIDGKYVKEPTYHGSPRVPAWARAVDYLPLIQSSTGGKVTNVRHHGESVFENTRGIYEKLNLVYSTMLQLVALSRNQAFSYMSRDGSKTLDENPFLEGSQVPLAEGEELNILPLLEMSGDTSAFLGLVSGEIQRGALPYSAYGQLAFQLSGYAVKLLGQAQEAPVAPRRTAIQDIFKLIASLMTDQYLTRSFQDGLQLSGRDSNRNWFDEAFSPKMLLGLGQPEITLVINTPQDELQKLEMALKLKASKLLPTRVIRDEVLERQDTDQIDAMVKEEEGGELLPAAKFYEVGRAMWEMGRQDLAMLYIRMAAIADITGMVGGAMGGGAPGANITGVSPGNLSAPDQGAPTPEPTPQAGANVPAGSPRPGAQESRQR